MKKRILILATLLMATVLFNSSYVLAENEKSQYQPFSREVYYNNCVIVYPKEDRGGYIIASGIASEAMKNSKISIQILKDSEAGEELKGKEFKEVLNNKEDIKVEGKTGVTMGTQEARVYVEK